MSEKMKVAVFRGVKDIVVEEHPIPNVTGDNLLLKIDACAICTWEQRVYTGVKAVEYPFIGGHELAAHIVALGPDADAKHFKAGDTVTIGNFVTCGNCFQCRSGNEQNCENFNHSKHLAGMPYRGMGGFSSHMMLPQKSVFHYRNVSPSEAALIEPIAAVTHSIETGDPQLGDYVVVIGCGIMGLLHVQLAAKKGAAVIVSDTNEERTALALTMGAKYRINPKKENLSERIMELSGGTKAQVVFDTTPFSAVVPDAVKCVANNGKVVLYSSFYPDDPVSISPDKLHKGAYALVGTANENTRDLVRASRLLSEGIVDVKPFISETYELARIKDALESAIKGDKFRVVVSFT